MEEHKRFWVGFSMATGIGPVRLRELIDNFGDVEQAWQASSDELYATGIPQKVVADFLETRARLDLDAELARIEGRGCQVLTWEDADYPDRLRELDAPPSLLYVWGQLAPEDRFAVGIVGTRRMSPYGRGVASDIAAYLGSNGITVVSGLARGVDGTAHRAALASGGRTIAVLGSGLDHIYPPEHRGLAKEISAQGAVISEYGLGTRPEARNFPPRNRIISGLSLVVVVVEAGEASGALITANFAAEQGRDVFAVPGNIHSPTSRGCHKLIQSGAQILLSPGDVLEALNMDVAVRHEAVQMALPEDEVERAVYEILGDEPMHVDEVRSRCGLPIASVTSALAMLELKGRARQTGAMTFTLARERGLEYWVE
jgi:DNA processing protein